MRQIKDTVLKERYPNTQLTPYNINGNNIQSENYSENKLLMLKNYLLHILQFGTPEERIVILGGIKSKFILKNGKLILT